MMIPAILVLLVTALVAVNGAGKNLKNQTLTSTILPYSARGSIPLKISSETPRFLSNKTRCGLDKDCWLSRLNTTLYPNGSATRSQRKSPLRMAREIHPNSNPQLNHGFVKPCWHCKWSTTSQPSDQGISYQTTSPVRMAREIRHEAVNGFVKPCWLCKWSTTSQPSATSSQPSPTTSQPSDQGIRYQTTSAVRMTREIRHEAVNGFVKPFWGWKRSSTSQPSSTTSSQPSDQERRYQRNSPVRMSREIRHEAVNGMDKMNWQHFRRTTTPRSSNSRIARKIDRNAKIETAGPNPELKDSGSNMRVYHKQNEDDVKTSQNSVPVQRILGGRRASLKEFPNMLSLWVIKGNSMSNLSYLCGATILNDYWALTAAHCLMDFNASKIIVRAGSYNKGNKSSDHLAEKFIFHEGFALKEGREFFLKDDIAVIKVFKRFELNNRTVKSARLPNQGMVISPGTDATAVGWADSETASSDLLQAAVLKIISKESCADLWAEQSAKLVQYSILCTQDSSKRFCGGTSGSPLFVKGQVVGIASAHLDVCVKTDLPGVHMDVAYFRDWIRKKTGA